MKILVLHQNFPGQFAHLIRSWSNRAGWTVRGIGRDTAPGLSGFAHLLRYAPGRQWGASGHPYLRTLQAAVAQGQAAARVMQQLKISGFRPDVILAHPGWGESLYAKDVFPDARLVHLCEWYYSGDGVDVNFDPEFPDTAVDHSRLLTSNALHALNLTQCDVGIAPTEWQRGRHPDIFQSRMHVQHEGIATHSLAPDPQASVTLGHGLTLRAGDPVVTMIARHLEPHSGIHIFMRALERIQQANPRCHALIVGSDEVGHSRLPVPPFENWREYLQQTVKLDPARTHFIGKVPHAQMVKVMQVSAAHVCLSYPRAISSTLLEAMACGAPLIAANTAPVREVLWHQSNAHLINFFDVADLSRTVLHCLNEPQAQQPLREQAYRDVQRYSLDDGLSGYEAALGMPSRRATDAECQVARVRAPRLAGNVVANLLRSGAADINKRFRNTGSAFLYEHA
jgi:glycosyltransferase involved in cell wall biosynthesis